MTPNQLLAACHAGDGGEWDIPFSLRFRSASLVSLSKTYTNAVPDSSLSKKTYSFWVKRGALTTAAYQTLVSGYNDGSNYWGFWFSPTDQLYFNNTTAGVTHIKATSRVFRDPSAWYHIALVIDTTQVIAEDRVKFYVNGERITEWATNTLPAQNSNNGWLAPAAGSNAARVGVYAGATPHYFDGYLTEIHAIDGLALTPSYFGQWSQESGQWVPIRYRGSYGTNGFYLDFKDASGITALGYDQSGQSNHWSPNNFSLTPGMYYDNMLDTPSNNYAIVSILKNFVANFTINNAGLSLTDSSTANVNRAAALVIPASGQWYWETTITSQPASGSVMIGAAVETAITSSNGITSNGCYRSNGVLYEFIGNGIVSSSLPTYTVNDIIGIAVDHVNGEISYYKNNVLAYTKPMGAGLSLIPIWASDNVAGTKAMHVNFGQQPFTYTPPAGFKALCSKNLPTPAIKRGETGFDVATWTGNGGNIQIGEYQFPRPSYLIDKSLRFKGVNSYLSRTPGVSGNSTTWTWSGWVKRGNLCGNTYTDEIFGAYANGAPGIVPQHKLAFNPSTNVLSFSVHNGSSLLCSLVTTRSFLNVGEWMHVVAVFDTTNATPADRMKLYINGIRIANFSSSITPTQNLAGYINNTAYVHQLGAYRGYTEYNFDGYMTEVNFIDGQALDPTSFGEFDINGYWIPKAYAGTHGANGFYLDFEDTSAVANLGFDKSGLGNNWAVNNFSLTAGITYDSMLDSPTNTVGIINTLLALPANVTVSEAGLKAVIAAGSTGGAFGPAGPNTGKWYFEFTVSPAGTATNGFSIGIVYGPALTRTGYNCFGTASVFYEGVDVAYGSILVTGNVLGVAYDLDAGWLEFYVNGVAKGKLNITKAAYESGGNVIPFIGNRGNGGGGGVFNFGQKPFAYTPPTDHKSLALANIAEYTEDLESPDLVWIKCRNAAQNHMLFDSIKNSGISLSSNTTAANVYDVNSLIQFNKNGFYLGNNANVNTLNNTYVAWMWKANQNKVTNNDGTLQSIVRANPALGFSVVQYVGNGAVATVGHGLGVRPDVILLKNIDSAYNWHVYHKDANANPATGVMVLNLTQAFLSYSPAWNNTLPTSSVFSLGNGIGVNESAKNHIAYCFSEVEGFSKFGLYVGNGSADGPFVYCGFKPRFIMYKARGEVGGWAIYDTERDADNIVTGAMAAQSNVAELISSYIDILSNGFKIRNTSVGHNTNDIGYVFMAFAECPFKYSTAQ